jgi:hypothetical protein
MKQRPNSSLKRVAIVLTQVEPRNFIIARSVSDVSRARIATYYTEA